MRMTTRLKAKIDQVPDAELYCTICENWKSANDFGHKPRFKHSDEGHRYEAACKPCRSLQMKLGSISEARAHLREGHEAFAAALNQARHPQRAQEPLTPLELRLRRERLEAKSPKPDVCYLVGPIGDDAVVKIGHSTDPFARVGEYQAGNPRKLRVIATIMGGAQTEQELHRKYHAQHQDWMVGEWFTYTSDIAREFGVALERIGVKR